MNLTVIEVSCGEYGDNIRKLVTAIKNGKHDIRTGQPFPAIEALNNSTTPSNNVKMTNAQNGNNLVSFNKDANDKDGVSEKKGNGIMLAAFKSNEKENGMSKCHPAFFDHPQ